MSKKNIKIILIIHFIFILGVISGGAGACFFLQYKMRGFPPTEFSKENMIRFRLEKLDSLLDLSEEQEKLIQVALEKNFELVRKALLQSKPYILKALESSLADALKHLTPTQQETLKKHHNEKIKFINSIK